MALVVPQILFTLSSTCPKWKQQCAQGLSCNTALNITFIIISLLLSQLGHSFVIFEKQMIGITMQVISVAVLWIEILAIMIVGKSGGMTFYIVSMVILTVIPVMNVITMVFTGGVKNKRYSRLPIISTTNNNVKKTGFLFPQLIFGREHDL